MFVIMSGTLTAFLTTDAGPSLLWPTSNVSLYTHLCFRLVALKPVL